MLVFERTSQERLDTEVSILNSDPYYNFVTKDKERLSVEEIVDEIKDETGLGAERYFIKDGEDYIGIIDFLMKNPNDGCTWLGLLLIRKERQAQGYGKKSLDMFYGMMKERGVPKLRIGVITENEPAHRFWKKQGFQFIRTAPYPGQKEVVVYEKSNL